MDKAKSISAWADVGYHLYAKEGMDGLQIERLSRILQVNKSSFYHYFGDLDGFCEALLKLHREYAVHYMEDIRSARVIDPDYLNVIVKYKVPILFQMQLIRSKKPAFYNVAQAIDQEEYDILRPVWSKYLEFLENSDLAIGYFDIVRDRLYTRMSFENLDYYFLRDIVAGAKVLMGKILLSKNTLEKHA
ncbi:MAG TPA: TetR/AcrR family transcriptional regulator [Chryseolinea sp.]|nr:TetR/AcrR family transcriptional regulator [Chryseolinea sp.]